MLMLFSPTIGAAIAAQYWFLWIRCPACRTVNTINLRTLDHHRDAAVSCLIPAPSYRSCRPNARVPSRSQLEDVGMRTKHQYDAVVAGSQR